MLWGLCEARPAPEVAARKHQSKRAVPVGGSVLEHDPKGRADNSILFGVLGWDVSSWGDLIQLVLGCADLMLGSHTIPALGPALLGWEVLAVAPRQALCWGTLLLPSAPLWAGIHLGHRDPARLQAGDSWDPTPHSVGWLRPAVLGSVLAVARGEGSPCSLRNCLRWPHFCPRQSCGLSSGCPCVSVSLQQLEELGQPCQSWSGRRHAVHSWALVLQGPHVPCSLWFALETGAWSSLALPMNKQELIRVFLAFTPRRQLELQLCS